MKVDKQQTTDGGYIAVGGTSNPQQSRRAWLIKTDLMGDTLWTRSYKGLGLAEASYVQQTPDGGYIVTGHTEDPAGNRISQVLLKNKAIAAVDFLIVDKFKNFY